MQSQPHQQSQQTTAQLVYPTRCPHCGQQHDDGLRPVGAQIVRAARAVAHLAVTHGWEWVTVAAVYAALRDHPHTANAVSVALHRASMAGLLIRKPFPASSHGGVRYDYRPAPLLAAYELPEPERTEEGGNVQ